MTEMLLEILEGPSRMRRVDSLEKTLMLGGIGGRRKIPQAEHAAIHIRHPSQSSLGWTQTDGWRGAEPWSLLPHQLCTEARACFFFLCSKGLYLLT